MVRRRRIRNPRLPPPSNDDRYGDRADEQVRKMAKHRIISAELEDFMRYLHSPWKIIWRNILSGLARGLGAIFGATIIVALAIWILKMFVDLPLIGQYAKQIRLKVDEVARETRYTDDFERVEDVLEQIDSRLKTQNDLLQKLIEQESELPPNSGSR